MDPRHGNHYNNSGQGQSSSSNFQYPGSTQNDPFNSFINTEDETAFDNTWQTPDFSSNQNSSNGFDHASQAWQQNPYPSTESNFLPISQYNVEPRYPTGESAYQFSNFNSNPNQDFASSRGDLHQPTYQRPTGFNPTSLNNGATFQFSGPQELEQASQTISPAAIESYPSFPQSSLVANRNATPAELSQRFGPSPSHIPYGEVRGGGVGAALSIQDWRHLATRTVKSIDKPGLRIKPTNQFENVTHSKRFDGFIFVGNSSVAVNSGKATVPRYKRKKSRNETMQFLEREKGGDPWHPDREPLVKKLKLAAKKQAGSRPTLSSVHGRGSSSSGSSDSDSDDSSEYYSESELEKEPDEPSPLPPARPVDPNKAVEYDLIKTVWAKRSSILSGTVIRVALGETWDIFKGIRDKWKAKCTSLQQAVEKKDQANERAFERRVTEQRRLLESCIGLTLKHGHPSIVEKLGENPVLLVVFYQFLADRIKYGEHNGSLISSILQLMVRCVNIDMSLLEKTKLDKLLQRLQKRGDEEGKTLAQKILDNAKIGKPTAPNHANGTVTKAGQDNARAAQSDTTKKDKQGDIKRPSIEGNAKNMNGISAGKVKGSSGDPKPVAKIGPDAADSKAKVVNVPSKPSAFFSSLKSASKKPGTSAKSDDQNSTALPKKELSTPAVAPKPAFSFAATMAGLAKQKEEVPSKAEETRKPETSEEKRKRLRKEQRRMMRVSFKDDEELVSIRTFVHDPEEEIGHEDSQVRDVGDSKGEGQMLKMHKDLELDDDEEYEPPDEISPPWIAPQPTDFSSIEESELARNLSSRGGMVEIISPERDVQRDRENGTLMAIYTSIFDIPPSPREPADHYTGDFAPEQSFGPPDARVKSRETEYRNRMDPQKPANVQQTPDISAILQIINNTKQPPLQQQQQSLNSSNPLAAIFAKLSNNASIPPAQTASQQPAVPAYHLQAALASMQQPQQQGFQHQPAYGTPQTNPVPNIQAILSQFNNQGDAPQAPPMQGFTYNSNPNTYGMNEDRKRQLESDDGDYGRKKARGGKPFIGTPRLPCKFWQEGKCRKGEECTFLHESS